MKEKLTENNEKNRNYGKCIFKLTDYNCFRISMRNLRNSKFKLNIFRNYYKTCNLKKKKIFAILGTLIFSNFFILEKY